MNYGDLVLGQLCKYKKEVIDLINVLGGEDERTAATLDPMFKYETEPEHRIRVCELVDGSVLWAYLGNDYGRDKRLGLTKDGVDTQVSYTWVLSTLVLLRLEKLNSLVVLTLHKNLEAKLRGRKDNPPAV